MNVPVRGPAVGPKAAPRPQRGAALLLAMLTVTLVAALAASAAWQQWRAIEIERAERHGPRRPGSWPAPWTGHA